jgi:hypothetical protein
VTPEDVAGTGKHARVAADAAVNVFDAQSLHEIPPSYFSAYYGSFSRYFAPEQNFPAARPLKKMPLTAADSETRPKPNLTLVR